MRTLSLKPFILAASAFALLACTRSVTNNVPVPTTSTVSTGAPASASAESTGGGVINGGGGRGVMCKKNGATSVQVLDLYEASALYKLNVINMGTDEEAAKNRLANLFARLLWNPYTVEMSKFAQALRPMLIDDFVKRIHFIDSGKTLKLVDDAHAPILENGCESVQIAYYYDESVLLIDKSLWEQLDETNKMALLAHEALYFYARQAGTTNSMSVRKLVGFLFSTRGARPLYDGVPTEHEKFVDCSIKKDGFERGHFFMYSGVNEQGTRGVQIVFQGLPGYAWGFRVSAFLSGISFAYMNQPKYTAAREAALEYETYPARDEVSVKFEGTQDYNLHATLALQTGLGGSLTETFQVSCPMPSDTSKLESDVTVPGSYRGSQASGNDDEVLITANGALTLTETRQVGGPGGISNSGVAPYPTVCRTVEHGVVLSQDENEIHYVAFSAELGDQTGLTDTAHCPDYVKAFDDRAADGSLEYTLKKSDFVKQP